MHFHRLTYKLLRKWYTSTSGTKSVTAAYEGWKAMLLHTDDDKFCVFLFTKGERSVPFQLEGELEEEQKKVLNLLRQELIDDWMLIGGRLFDDLDYVQLEEVK